MKCQILFSSKNMDTICMKCQILFSWKNKKNISNLSSAELAQRMVKVNMVIYMNTVITGVLDNGDQSLVHEATVHS